MTPKVQVPPAATSVPLQLSAVRVKGADVVRLLTLSETRLGLLNVVVSATVATSSGCSPKLRCVGEKVGRIRIPLPVRFTVWGLLWAPSVMVRVPVRVPV
jgi:hypothetical protein